MGGDGSCPTCLAQGVQVPETAEHRAIGCTTTVLITRACLSQWAAFTGETWANPLIETDEFHPGDTMEERRAIRRAMILGLRPEGQTDSAPALIHDDQRTHPPDGGVHQR